MTGLSGAYRYGEGRTADGQLVSFTTGGDVDEAIEKLGAFKSLRIPTSKEMTVEHGSFGRYSRYDIDKVEYYGGEGGYFEVLNIKDAPEGRHPIVSHSHGLSYGEWVDYFVEWETVKDALTHLHDHGTPNLPSYFTEEKEPFKGYMRTVELGMLTPWFYATGDAETVGDFVFPENLGGDPVYTFGRQFMVPISAAYKNEVAHVAVKTAMGAITQQVPVRSSPYGYTDNTKPANIVRTVQWSDGTMTKIDANTPASMVPRPIEQAPWVVDAVSQVQKVMAGTALNFTVNFADGGKFVGKYIEPQESVSNAEGDYNAKVQLADGSIKAGWVYGFVPTPETPTVTAYIEKHYKEQGVDIITIEIVEQKTKAGGKKWKGLYYGSIDPADQAVQDRPPFDISTNSADNE